MSRRQIRKINGNNTLPPPDSDSENDFFGSCFHTKPTTRSLYAGLELSSESDCSEPEFTEPESSSSNHEPPTLSKKHKYKKSTKKCNNDEDDIDKSVREINKLLGAPPPAATTSVNTNLVDPFISIFNIESRNLNKENELRRLFGSDDNGVRTRRRQLKTVLASKRIKFVSTDEFEYPGRIGLSMSVVTCIGSTTYFAFDHSAEYQKRHRLFLKLPTNYINSMVEKVFHTHIEAHLEVADVLFELEEFSNGCTMVEYIIGMMQQVFHPLFNLNSDIRLEYKYLENRPFHIALLKYLYLVSNKACHRTALEVAKFLMRIDPTDPLAVIFVIDSVALKAREHEWLLKASEYWSRSSGAKFLFNINYSKALATYHVATKNKDDLTIADELLKDAILQFPTVAYQIKDLHKDMPSGMISHELFTTAVEKTGKNLIPLINLYIKLSNARWREPPVAEWLTKNIKGVMEQYTNVTSVKAMANYYNDQRISLFRGIPTEVRRHLSTIQSMSPHMLDGVVPHQFTRFIREPLTGDDVINRYNYQRPTETFDGH